jgi:hypothetical protein
MNLTSRPDDFEQRNLIEKVEDAQLVGRDCYLRTEGGEVAVHIRSGDIAVLSIDNLRAVGDVNFGAVEFSFEPLTAAIEGGAMTLNGRGEFDPEQFADFLATHPLESIASVRDLAQLFDNHFGSGADWRVYSGFLKALPENLSDATLHTLIVPLLSAGELSYIPAEVEEILQKYGWSEEQIKASFSEDERDQRSAKQYFLEQTGVPITEIRTADDLARAISGYLVQNGNCCTVLLLCEFIQAHHFTEDTDQVERLIFPFINMFGPEGYQNIQQALDMCEYAGSWNMPPYRGPSQPHYGEEPGDG